MGHYHKDSPRCYKPLRVQTKSQSLSRTEALTAFTIKHTNTTLQAFQEASSRCRDVRRGQCRRMLFLLFSTYLSILNTQSFFSSYSRVSGRSWLLIKAPHAHTAAAAVVVTH